MSWRNFLTPNDDQFLNSVDSSKKNQRSPIVVSSIHFRDGSDKSCKFFQDKASVSEVHDLNLLSEKKSLDNSMIDNQESCKQRTIECSSSKKQSARYRNQLDQIKSEMSLLKEQLGRYPKKKIIKEFKKKKIEEEVEIDRNESFQTFREEDVDEEYKSPQRTLIPVSVNSKEQALSRSLLGNSNIKNEKRRDFQKIKRNGDEDIYENDATNQISQSFSQGILNIARKDNDKTTVQKKQTRDNIIVEQSMSILGNDNKQIVD